MKKPPAIVYKYFNWDDIKSRKVLTEKEIYFCNAKKWKNYGEYNFKFKAIDKTKMFYQIENTVYVTKHKNLPLFIRWLRKKVNLYKIDTKHYESLNLVDKELWETRIIGEIICRMVDEIVQNIDHYENAIKNYYYSKTGIFSTSLFKNSEQLWNWKSKYKGQFNGNAVCIGLNLTKIKHKLDTIGNYSLGTIEYGESLNEVELIGSGDDFLIDQINSITFTLKKDSAPGILEQEELRLVKFIAEDISENSPNRFMKIGDDFITKIIVHTNATTATKIEVEAIAKNINCNDFSLYNPI